MGEAEFFGDQFQQTIDIGHACTSTGSMRTDGVETILDGNASPQIKVSLIANIPSENCAKGYDKKVQHKLGTGRVHCVHKTSQVTDELNFGDPFESLPDHLVIEALVRLPTSCWASAACVRKRWAALFRGDLLWQTALMKRWPGAGRDRRWPGPIGRGSDKRRYIALHVSKNLFSFEDQEGDVHELAGHVYLFLKEQLEVSSTPLSYGLLHGTIVDQFLACGKAGGMAHDLASRIWLAVIDNLDESEHTFHLLMQIVEEWEVFLPYPYSRSHAVQWRLFERLFTDFRDCLSRFDYYNVLTQAKHKFEIIPSTWLGY